MPLDQKNEVGEQVIYTSRGVLGQLTNMTISTQLNPQNMAWVESNCKVGLKNLSIHTEWIEQWI